VSFFSGDPKRSYLNDRISPLSFNDYSQIGIGFSKAFILAFFLLIRVDYYDDELDDQWFMPFVKKALTFTTKNGNQKLT